MITVSNGVSKPYLNFRNGLQEEVDILKAAGAIPPSFALALHRHAAKPARKLAPPSVQSQLSPPGPTTYKTHPSVTFH
jgi:hypothetical protein